MKCFALSSGSAGNCFYFEDEDGKAIIIDMGLSYSRVKEILDHKGKSIEKVEAVFITHEHGDHCKGVSTAFKNMNSNFYMSRGTAKALNFNEEDVELVSEHSLIEVAGFRVFVLSKSHDAEEPVSYLVELDGRKAGVFTDLGEVSEEMKFHMRESDVLFMEANYCDEMASANEVGMSSTYITRLCSNMGHLSILQTCKVLEEITNSDQVVILSHISENLNCYERTYRKVSEYMRSIDKLPDLRVSVQGEPTEWICVKK